MNSKIIIINPEDKENKLVDGTINCLGNIGGDHMHSDLLIEYGYKTYGDNSIFEILSQGNYMVEIPAYFLSQEFDNILFLNISNNKMGKKGLLYLPSTITEKQVESLATINIQDFSIEANYNLSLNEGFIDCEIDRTKGKEVIEKLKQQVKKRKTYIKK